jgi:tetratricopeptide (TPR) repeat protein
MHGYHKAIWLVVITLLAWSGAPAQTGSRPSSRTTPSTPSGSGDNLPQTIMVVGKVVMADGSALPGQVTIVSLCGSNSHREAVARPDGSFSFVLGDRSSSVVQDASNSNQSDSIYPGKTSGMTNNPGGAPAEFDTRTLADCQLIADLHGYQSSHAAFPGMPSGTINVGVLVLHSHGSKSDAVVSVTSLQAPGNARKEFEKGKVQLDKGKLEDAEASLRKAVDEYPRYAEAWYFLGNVQTAKKDSAAAHTSYEQAQKADPSYPPPYLPLARAAALAHQWQDALVYSDRLIALDAAKYPMAYYYSATANYNLNHLPEAEASALKAENLDKAHAEPRLEIQLGLLYTAKQNYSAAAEHYRTYVQLVPDGPLTAQVKSDLAKCEEMAKASGPQDGTPKP